MKHRTNRFFRSVFLFASILLAACDSPVSLGSKVDLAPPRASIDSLYGPGAGAYIRETAEIFVDAQDDSGIAQVSARISFKVRRPKPGIAHPMAAVADHWDLELCTAELPGVLDPSTGRYKVVVDTTNAPGVQPPGSKMADGDLEMAVIAVDNTGKRVVNDPVIYKIDNTAPAVELQIPLPARTPGNDDFDNSGTLPSAVAGSSIIGILDDGLGIGLRPGFPLLKLWRNETGLVPPPPDTPDGYRQNAGWANVSSPPPSLTGGWVPADRGFVGPGDKLKISQFRYAAKERDADGFANGPDLPPGKYSLMIWGADLNDPGLETHFPEDYSPSGTSRIDFTLEVNANPPLVFITANPDRQNHNGNFTISARAESRTSGASIGSLELRVYDKNSSKGYAVLASVSGDAIRDFAIPYGASIVIPDRDYQNSFTFGDGSYTFMVYAEDDTGANSVQSRSFTIDTELPQASINEIKGAVAYEAKSPGAPLADYTEYTVNGTISVPVKTTDNNGLAWVTQADVDARKNTSAELDYAKFKYILSAAEPAQTGAEALWGAALFFDEPPADQDKVRISKVLNGEYLVKINTRKYTSTLGDLWFYVIAEDTAGNFNYRRALFKIDQATDIPQLTIETIGEDGRNLFDKNMVIRISASDDDGFDTTIANGALQFRFNKKTGETAGTDFSQVSVAPGGFWTHPDTGDWYKIVNADPPGSVLGYSRDGKSITAFQLSLGALENYLRDDGKDLGDESDLKAIEFRIVDDRNKKVAFDGNHANESQAVKTALARFTLDLTPPEADRDGQIRFDKEALDGTGLYAAVPSGEPFIRPQKEKTYNQGFTAWGWIKEEHFKSFSVTVDEWTVPYKGPDSQGTSRSVLPAWETPWDEHFWKAEYAAGRKHAMAVKNTARDPGWNRKDLLWYFPMDITPNDNDPRSLWDRLDEGPHSFRIDFVDWAGNTKSEQVNFYKEVNGPAIDFINPGEKVYLTDQERNDLNAYLERGTSLSAGLAAKYSRLTLSPVKDMDAKLIGNFTNKYSPLYSSVNTRFYYQLDNTGPWNSLTLAATDSKSQSWQIPLDNGLVDGAHTISIRVKNSGGNGCSVTDSPQGSGGFGFETNIGFIVDRRIPELVIDSPVEFFYSGDFTLSGRINNAALPTLAAKLGGSDIAQGRITLDPQAPHGWTINVPAGALAAEKSYSVAISARGNSGRTATEVLSFTFDKTPPAAAVTAPAAGTQAGRFVFSNRWVLDKFESGLWINGESDVRGANDDKNGISKIEYHIGRLDENNEAEFTKAAVWQDTLLHTAAPASGWSGGLYYWTYHDNFSDYENRPLLIESAPSAGAPRAFYLPFYVKVNDPAGNVRVLKYRLWVDPDMDKPQAFITNPAKGAIVGGEVRISGTAIDDDWIYGVQIRIRNSNGVYYKNPVDTFIPAGPETLNESNWLWAKIAGNSDRVVAWDYSINSDGLLNPSSGQNQVEIEVRAVDTQDILHQHPTLTGDTLHWSLTFDANYPSISNVKITRDGVSRDYAGGIRSGGTFTISADIQDEGGISSIKVRRSGEALFTEVINDSTAVTKPAELNTASWIRGYKYYITNPGSGVNWQDIDLDYTPSKTYTQGMTIRYKPSAALPVSGSALAYQASGIPAANDADSANWDSQFFKFSYSLQVDSLALFPYGKTGTYSLEMQVTDNNSFPAPYLTQTVIKVLVDNFYPETEINTQYAASTRHFTLEGIAKDYSGLSGPVQGVQRVLVYFERNGVKMNAGGIPFASSGTAPVKRLVKDGNNPDYQTALADMTDFPCLYLDGGVWKSPHAMVIDKQEVGASTDLDGDGTFGEVFDGLTDVIWQARFDTRSLSDGKIRVHYLVMDLADNASHYTQDIYIRNKPPIIRSFSLGTDINASGLVEDQEMSLPFDVKDYLYHTAGDPLSGIVKDSGDTDQVRIDHAVERQTGFVIKNWKFRVDIAALFGNGSKFYRISHVTQDPNPTPATALVKGRVYKISDDPTNFNWTRVGASATDPGTIFVALGPAQTGSMGSAYGFTPAPLSAEKNAPFGGNGGNSAQALFSGTGPSARGDFANMADSITGDSDVLKRNKLFIIKVYDSTESSGAEEDQLAHAALFNADIDNDDEKKPEALVNPFHWNGENENSLYENSRARGHIELEGDLPSRFSAASGLDDRDPKVSGRISIRGSARDNNIIESLWIKMDGFDFGGTQSIGGSPGYTRAAAYSGGVLNGEDHWAAAGWKFSVSTMSHDLEGHQVAWQLDLDTSKIQGAAALDRAFRIRALDKALNASAEDSAQTRAGAPTAYYRMDIVPYITALETPFRNQGGLKSSNIRSADGKYSVIQGTGGNFITVKGFNLNPSGTHAVQVQNAAQRGAYNPAAAPSGTTGSSLAVYPGSVAADYTSFALTHNSLHSGYLAVYTNGIGSLNNINNNNSLGAYRLKRSTGNAALGTAYQLQSAAHVGDAGTSDGSDEVNMPNREADRYITKNITLTDDRYLQFYTVKKTDVKNGYYPVMIMNGNNPVFAYLDPQGGPEMEAQTGPGGGAGIGSTATPARAADAWPQRTEFDASGSGRLYTEYLVKGLNWEQMAMARDESGRYVHATVSNYHDGGLEFIYDRYAELCNTNTEKGAFGWASCVTYTNWPISNVVNKWFFRTFDPNNTALGLEKMGYAPGLQLDRYQRPKLMVKGDSYAGVAANYLVYFDEASGDIIFRTFQIGSASPSRPLRMGFENTALKDSQSRDYSTTYTNCTENVQIGPSRNDSAWGDGRNIAVSGGSKYFDSGVTSDNRVIIVYYDENDARLKLAYSDKNIDGSKTTGIPFTQGNAVLPDYTGMYVSMTIDAQDGIHIAAFDAKDSDLAYIYLPRYDAAACQAVIVDQFGSVGNWTDIKVRGGVPYIAYYNATETGGRDSIKLAWAKTAVQGNAGVQSGTDAAGYTSSGWEYATVPAIDPPQGGTQKFRKVNLDFDSAGRPVLGYLGTNIEFSRPVGE